MLKGTLHCFFAAGYKSTFISNLWSEEKVEEKEKGGWVGERKDKERWGEK